MRPNPIQAGPIDCRGLRRGMTFVELMIGLMITAMVGGAAAALMGAVSASWQATQAAQSLQITSRQSAQTVERLIKTARFVGLATADGQLVGTAPANSTGAAILFWRQDTNGDGIMQLGEVSLLQHDPGAGTLKIHQLGATAAGKTTACTSNDLKTSASASQFGALPGCDSYVLASNVAAAVFRLNTPPGGRPSVEYALKFRDGSAERMEYGTSTMRMPTTQAVQVN
jgi:type II secretory pathway component PulJ